MLSILPPEIRSLIYYYLLPESLVNASKACTKFYKEVGSDPYLQRKYLQDIDQHSDLQFIFRKVLGADQIEKLSRYLSIIREEALTWYPCGQEVYQALEEIPEEENPVQLQKIISKSTLHTLFFLKKDALVSQIASHRSGLKWIYVAAIKDEATALSLLKIDTLINQIASHYERGSGYPIGLEWICKIALVYKKTALYFLQTKTLVNQIAGHSRGLRWICEIALKYEETALYFLQTKTLVNQIAGHSCGLRWIYEIALKYEETALYFLQTKTLVNQIAGHCDRRSGYPIGLEWICKIALKYKKTALYFLQTETLVDLIASHCDKDGHPIGLEWICKIASVYKETALHCLQTSSLYIQIAGSRLGPTWIPQIREKAGNALSNTEHTERSFSALTL
jgi:ribosomal protein S17E